MAAVAPKETDQAAAAASDNDNNARPPAKLLHPQLLLAARRGDSKRLKELLGLEKDDDDDDELQVPKAAAKQDEGAVVVEVDRHRPSSAAAAAAPDDSPPLPLLGLDGVTAGEGDSLLHVVAASGDGQDFLDCATMIHDQVSKGLLGARNNKGDTPLHCAAGAGNTHMISRLVALVTGNEAAAKAFLRLQNDLGETALHHAVRAANMPAIDQLLSLDSELPCRRSSIIPRPCEGGEKQQQAACSPLYLAVSLGEMDIARHLFDASSSRSKRKLSYYSGPNERNALHAAVSRKALVDLLEWFKNGVVDIEGGDGRVVMSVPLVSQLTNQRDKHSGSTPLHLAAARSSFPFQKLGREIRLLLDANESTAYQPDNKGLYPIHVAAWSGRLNVVKALLGKCPECATLRDAKGRTFLHVAIVRKKRNVVKYVCSQSDSQAELSSVLNAQDINGDTPLHHAVDVGEIDVFNCLLENPRVRLDVANKEAMTPVDLSITKIPSQFHYTLNPRGQILITLILMRAKYGENRADLFLEKHGHKEESEEKLSKKLTGATQVLSVVSVLIATVTFASAFTLPGGNRSDDAAAGSSSAGTPLFAGTYAFDAFILADVIAFICSSLATFSLLYAGMPSVDLPSRFWYINVAALLLMNSARTLVVAFALGLYVVLLPVARRDAIIVCAITLASLLLGHKELRRMLFAAKMVWARYGTGRIPLFHVFLALLLVLAHFWSFLIIFGVPAIRNRK